MGLTWYKEIVVQFPSFPNGWQIHDHLLALLIYNFSNDLSKEYIRNAK